MPRRPRPAGLGSSALAGIRGAADARRSRHVRGGRPRPRARGPREEDRQGRDDAARQRSGVARGDARGTGEGMTDRPLALSGKVSLVTGASRGIGRAIAKALAAEGAAVVLGARDTGKLAEAVGEIRSAGGKAESLTPGATDRASGEAAAESILKAHGRLDHLVNNAGVTRDNLLLRMKGEEWQQVL